MNVTTELIQVFSSGGGTQSACIAALICVGRLPKPDFTVIADTGREKPTTWLYNDQVIAPNLKKVGVDIVRVGTEWQSMPEHGKNWMSHNGKTILLPGYSNISGEVGKISGFCSKTWKGQVIDRWLSQTHGVTRSKYQKWIGFSLDEGRRVSKMMRGEDYQKGLIRFPLVFDVQFRRRDSVRFVEAMGWPRDNESEKIHPTQKPVRLLQRLINLFTDPGDVVIDPVCGSGSSIIAACRCNRSGFGFEIKKDFHKAACGWLEREKQQISLL